MQHRQPIISTNEEYRNCLNLAAALRDKGARAESCETLAVLEAAISEYSLEPGKPAESKGRPDQG